MGDFNPRNDTENRLARLTTLTTTNVFGYDGGGARLWKQGTNTLQVWIGGNYEEKQGRVLFHVLAEERAVCTFDATTTNVFEYYPTDHLNSSAVLTDKVGTPIQHHEYSAFGRDRYTGSTSAFPLSRRYTSKTLDEDTGLYFYEARYYDPEIGRFIQPDTIIPDHGNPQSYNRYSYVLNNPLRHIDPDGHQPVMTPSQAGFISPSFRAQVQFHRFIRETGQEYRPQGRIAGQYGQAFARAAERSIAEQNQMLTYGRVLRPGETFLSAARTPSAPLTAQAAAQAGANMMRQTLPPEQLFGVQANKSAGDSARDAIALREAPALREVTFQTVGGSRRTDVLKLSDQLIAIESKVGRTALDSRVRQELARDWWLMRQNQVDKVRWEFSPSKVTGQGGPTRQLSEKIHKLGFEIKNNDGQ